MRISLLTVGSVGDVIPYVALGSGLHAAGFDVCVAAHERFKRLITERGLRFSPVNGDPQEILRSEAGQRWLASGSDPFKFLRRMIDAARPSLLQMMDDYWRVAQESDLLLFHTLATLAARSIVEKLHIPAYPAYLQPLHPTRFYPTASAPPLRLPIGKTLYNRLTHALSARLTWRLMVPILNQWRAGTLGLPPFPARAQFDEWTHEHVATLYGFSPAVVPKPADWGDELQVTGYWFLEKDAHWEPPAELLDFLHAGPPPVFIGFGSMADPEPEKITRIALEAIRITGQRAVLSSGWSGLGEAKLPRNVFRIGTVPHDWLFPRMAAVVHHGGAGTTAMGLRAGVPSVVVHYFADQPFWAWRVEQLGVGPAPLARKKISVARLVERIESATSDAAMIKRAAALGARIRAEDGVARAVDVVRKLAGTATVILLMFGMALLWGCGTGSQEAEQQHRTNFAVIRPSNTMHDIVEKAARVVPSDRQMMWQEREFIAFLHFGMNTFTNREWGTGKEDPALFNPSDLDARQWVSVLKAAGVKLVIITAKHHDGFCLWPSAYTEHSVKRSPWRGGKGDVVRELADACREQGMKLGIYLSPWDRHEPTYGDSPRYNEYFRNQLRELLTNYGDVSEVWFDGACGEGPNGKRQVYDWPSYYRVVRELQPHAVIFGMGPDVRWVGTESGYGRETEWSVIPDRTQSLDSVLAIAQKDPIDGAFMPGDLTDEDLGSRARLRNARSLIWYPAETDVSIRPGWFYHAAEDSAVKSPEKLVDIYFNSVGRNGVLLLNVPPDRRGLIHQSDINSLTGMHEILRRTFGQNLVAGAMAAASNERGAHRAGAAMDNDPATYWTTEDGVDSAALEFTFPGERRFDVAMLQEQIHVGQRVERFRLEVWDGNGWEEIAHGTTIGYKRLLRFPEVQAQKVRLVIDSSRASPTLCNFGLYSAPAGLSY